MPEYPALTTGLASAFTALTPASKGFNLPNDTFASVAAPKPFSDVEEVTIDNPAYYPVTQPYVPRVLLKFFSLESTSAGDTLTVDLRDSNTDYFEVLPQNLLSFTGDFLTNEVAKIKISLFDPTWGDIEQKLVKNRGLFALRFGYPDKLMSAWFKILTTGYSLEFKQSGIIIHIFGLASGFELNLQKKFKGFGEKNQLISDIVKEIVKDINATGDIKIKDQNIFIEPTAPVLARDGISGPELVQKIFQQAGQTDLEFIINTLAQYALSAEGNQGNYQYYIHTNPDTNDVEFHFHTMYYKYKNDSGLVPAFTMFRDKNSALINFSPLWNQTVANISGGSGSFSSVIDLNKSTLSQVKKASDTAIMTDQTGGGQVNTQEKMKDDPTQTFGKKFTTSYTPGSNTMLQIISETNKQTELVMGALQAEVEIVGNPKAFKIFDKVAVLIFSPTQNSESQKLVHWISGYFRIIGISHNITPGRYTTKLRLITASRQAIYTDPLKTIPSKQ